MNVAKWPTWRTVFVGVQPPMAAQDYPETRRSLTSPPLTFLTGEILPESGRSFVRSATYAIQPS